MKTIDPFVLAALPGVIAKFPSAQAPEEAYEIAKATIKLLCKKSGHDWDVLTPKGICQRCGKPRDRHALDRSGVTETNFGTRKAGA